MTGPSATMAYGIIALLWVGPVWFFIREAANARQRMHELDRPRRAQRLDRAGARSSIDWDRVRQDVRQTIQRSTTGSI